MKTKLWTGGEVGIKSINGRKPGPVWVEKGLNQVWIWRKICVCQWFSYFFKLSPPFPSKRVFTELILMAPNTSLYALELPSPMEGWGEDGWRGVLLHTFVTTGLCLNTAPVCETKKMKNVLHTHFLLSYFLMHLQSDQFHCDSCKYFTFK